MSYTYAVMEVSDIVYAEIRHRMLEANYKHALRRNGTSEVIDMHGIALHSLPAAPVRPGTLQVGLSAAGEVVINHPKLDVDETGAGYLTFSPKEARALARLLNKWAGQSGRAMTSTPTATSKRKARP